MSNLHLSDLWGSTQKLAIKMTPVRIFDIDNYPAGIQLAITRSEVEKAKVFQMEMKKRGIDF